MANLQYQYIETYEALAEFCSKAAKKDAIAIDTEFVRTRTYYPRLGLLQACDGEQLVLIDPLKIEQFDCFIELLRNTEVTKILHSCSEDVEVFWHYFNVIPQPLFDSQIAASFCNMGNALGYAKLVDDLLGVTLDKGESRTDWIARPLTDKQCEYAANDVSYLMQLYPTLLNKVKEKGRLDWVFDETSLLTNKKEVQLPSEWAYLNLKQNWMLRGKSLLVLQKLAQWRLEKAKQRDTAINFVIRESVLIEIAKKQPKNLSALRAVEGVGPIEVRRHGKEIIEIVLSAQDTPNEDFPANIQRLTDFPRFKAMSKAIRSACEEKAENIDVAIEILCSKRQVNQLLKWLWLDQDETRIMQKVPDLLIGWRKQILQKPLEQILDIELE